jgi:hypothetical protein
MYPANCIPYKLSNGFIGFNISYLNPLIASTMRVRADTIYNRIQELDKTLQLKAYTLAPGDSFHNNELSE